MFRRLMLAAALEVIYPRATGISDDQPDVDEIHQQATNGEHGPPRDSLDVTLSVCSCLANMCFSDVTYWVSFKFPFGCQYI